MPMCREDACDLYSFYFVRKGLPSRFAFRNRILLYHHFWITAEITWFHYYLWLIFSEPAGMEPNNSARASREVNAVRSRSSRKHTPKINAGNSGPNLPPRRGVPFRAFF